MKSINYGNFERRLSMAESIILFLLDSNWIDYEVTEGKKSKKWWFNLLFFNEKNLKKAADVIVNNLQDYWYSFKYYWLSKRILVIVLWNEKIYLKLVEKSKLSIILHKINNTLFSFFNLLESIDGNSSTSCSRK